MSPTVSPGSKIYSLMETLFPLHRSITGEGVRQTLNMVARIIPLTIHEVPSGTPVFDWEVPREWQIREAFIEDESGHRVIDYADSNLHVLNYSTGVDTTMSWSDLKPHLFSNPETPDWIPYRTSYFKEQWGFCVSFKHFQQLESRGEKRYRVKIDASLIDGSLTYGELKLPGELKEEVLISCHICHPSLANDNLSGIGIATYLADYLSKRKNRYTYRFVFVPATIGAITWLSQNRSCLPNISHGLVLALLGDRGFSTYKKSRAGDAEIDRAMMHVLEHSNTRYTIIPFEPHGYDERQYCSPGINLPVGCLMRTPNQKYPEYHSSGDNMGIISTASLQDSYDKCVAVFDLLENNYRYRNLRPYGEPQLGKYDLYSEFEHGKKSELLHLAVLWVLNLSDGGHTLLQIAERAEIQFDTIREAAETLLRSNLIERCEDNPAGSKGAGI